MAREEASSASPARHRLADWRRLHVAGSGGAPDVERMLLVFAGLRIFVGLIWIANLSWKLPPDLGRHNRRGLLYSLRRAHRWALVGQLREFVGNVVIPHFTLFGSLIFVIELTAGVLLTFGVMTRLGAVVGTLQSVTITLLVGRAPNEWLFGYAMFIILNALPLLVPADARVSIAHVLRTASVDAGRADNGRH